jgi:16S rRNA (guanine527-N7)-methyltransferase
MERLIQETKKLTGYSLNEKQVEQFKRYEEELLDWNSRFNLTAVRDSEGIRIKHFLDSLSCLQVVGSHPPLRLIDVGTGAGFPGIPLKICFPAMQLTLVESVGKKADFCRHLVSSLGLDKVEVVQARAEEIGQMPQHREKYDVATARAVANLPILVEYLLPLVRLGGIMLAQKGENGPIEAQSVEKTVKVLGGHFQQLREINLPGVAENRYFIIISKVAVTPPQYPRRVGIPQKTPIK